MGSQVTYQSLDRPYDNLLQRGAVDIANVSSKIQSPASNTPVGGSSSSTASDPYAGSSQTSAGGSPTSGTTPNGSVEQMPVKSDGAMGDVWIDNFIRSKNWKPKKVGFNIDGQSGYAEFTDVYISGQIEALSGLIGGFTIGDTDISATEGLNTTTISSGPIAFTSGPTLGPTVTITQDGYFTATRANITGSITAQSGAIGGFEINDTYLTAGYGDTRIRLDTLQGIFLGDNDFDLAPFSVSLAGDIKSTSGTIGGWTLASNSLYTPTIILDSLTEKIKVGRSSPIVIDGLNKKIESSNYSSGVNGSGFHIDENLMEVGNISARGLIKSAVFQKGVVSTIGGSLAVLDGDVLDADMTANDSSTLTIKGNTTFAFADIIRIKDGLNDEWLQISSAASAPTYTVTRDKASVYGANNNPAWKKGATVVNYGQTGAGGVYMTSSDSNAPYINIFDHQGAPWTTINTRVRIGNLNGYLGYSSNVYGIAIGDSDYNLKYDPTNGLNIQGNITIGSSNYIKGGQTDFFTGTGFFLGYSGDYKFSIGNTTNYLTWDGTYLRMKGSFDVGAGGLINNGTYTVATLPIVPVILGFNNPTGIE